MNQHGVVVRRGLQGLVLLACFAGCGGINPQGAQGPQGPKGEQGPEGEQGQAGPGTTEYYDAFGSMVTATGGGGWIDVPDINVTFIGGTTAFIMFSARLHVDSGLPICFLRFVTDGALPADYDLIESFNGWESRTVTAFRQDQLAGGATANHSIKVQIKNGALASAGDCVLEAPRLDVTVR